MATAPPLGIRRTDIQPILGRIQVEVGQIHHAEVLHRLEEAEELEGLEGVGDIGEYLGHAVQHVAIQFRQVFVGNGILGGVEVVQVAQQEAGCIADLAVHIRHLLEDVATQGHVGGIIHRGYPQAQHIGPVGWFLLLVFAAVDDDVGIDHIAHRLAHFAALFIQGKAVGEHRFVGGVAVDSNASEQAALEPAPVLVGAF